MTSVRVRVRLRAAGVLLAAAGATVLDGAVNALARVGLVRVRDDRSVAWPVYVDPWWTWRAQFWPARGPREPLVAVFRNAPGVVKWLPGRLLPRRWGVKVLGLELGDRGGGPRLLLRTRTGVREVGVGERVKFVERQVVVAVDTTPAGLPFQPGEHLLYLGEVHAMPGHAIVVKRSGKVIWGFHDDNFRHLADDGR